MKKKTRFLALLLCFVLAFGFLPATSRAADDVVTFEAVKTTGDSHVQFTVTITAVVNRTAKKADVTFTRSNFAFKGKEDKEYLKEEYPDSYKAYLAFSSQNYGHLTADVVEDKLDYDQGNVNFRLENFSWDTAKFQLENPFAPNGFVGRFIVINKWKKVTVGGLGNGHVGLGESDEYGSAQYSFKQVGNAPSEPQGREYTIKRDNFSFSNARSSFVSTSARPQIFGGQYFESGTYGAMLDGTAYNTLTNSGKASQIAAVNAFLSEGWQGSCLGMSVMSGLFFEELIALDRFGTASDVFGLAAPVENDALMRTITYYQIADNNTRYKAAELPDLSEQLASKLVKSLQDDPQSPVVVRFRLTKVSGKEEELVLRGHAVLAFKVEEKNAGYDVSVYDPNCPDETRHLYIDDMRQVSLPDYANTYLTRIDKAETLYNANLYYPAPASGEAVIHTNGDVDLEVGGASASIRGEKKTGDLPVETGGENGSGETVIYVPVSGGQSIRVRRLGGAHASVQTGNTFALITGGAEEVTVNADGSVTAKTNGSAGSLAVASDKTGGSLFGTTVETKAPEITVAPTGTGANVTTSGGTADITVSGTTDSVKFEGVDTSKGVDVENSGKNSTLSSDGREIAKGTANAGGGTTQNTPAQPAADKQQIGNNAAQKAGGNSAQIVSARRDGGDTSGFRSRHRNVKYSAWAEKEIAIADDFEIIPSALLQKLQGNITRREFAQLVYNTVKAATGMTDADMAKYAAKPSNAYASQYSDPAVAFAYGVGIVGGYEDGSFRPENTITREQAAKMLVVMAELLGKLTSESGAKQFRDAPNNWAQTYINKISSITSPYSGQRVMGGDEKNNFMPNGTFTTEQAVATMLRMFESVVGEKSGYSGGVITPTNPVSPTPSPAPAQTNTTVTTVEDRDQTGYTPKDWSWVAEGEGYGRKYFTSGKYVRDDGRAVIYIDSGDSSDGFSYQLFVMAGGAKQENYEAHDFSGGTSYCWASNSSENKADDTSNGLLFHSLGNGCMILKTNWLDEMYLAYDLSSGDSGDVFYLVREKK